MNDCTSKPWDIMNLWKKTKPVGLSVVTWKDPKALLLSETTIPLGGKKMEIYT